MDYIIKDGELSHAGILGMKWGVRRYQNKDGTLTADGRKRYGVNPRTSRKKYTKEQLKDMEKSIKAKEKKAKVAKKSLDKARKAKDEKAEAAKKAKQEQEEFEAGKKKALESGSAEDVLKYKGQLTNKELQEAFTRINFERQLSKFRDEDNPQVKTGMDKAEDIMDKIDRTRAMTEKGISAYNTGAKLINTFTDYELPTIDGTSKKSRAEKKAEEKAKKAEEKAKKAEEKAEKAAEKARKKLVESGTPEEIEKNFGKFTAKELSDIETRFAKEADIRKRADEARAAREKANREATEKMRAEYAEQERYNRLQAEANARHEKTKIRPEYSTTSYKSGATASGKRYADDVIIGEFVDKTPSNVSNSRQAQIGRSYVNSLLEELRDDD